MRGVAMARDDDHGAAVMLTGHQIAAARRLAGITRQSDLAKLAEVSRVTVERAEQAGANVPSMNTTAMTQIVRALEQAGIEFYVDRGASLVGGVGMRLRAGG